MTKGNTKFHHQDEGQPLYEGPETAADQHHPHIYQQHQQLLPMDSIVNPDDLGISPNEREEFYFDRNIRCFNTNTLMESGMTFPQNQGMKSGGLDSYYADEQDLYSSDAEEDIKEGVRAPLRKYRQRFRRNSLHKSPHLVAKRNARERKRVQAVNAAFSKLRRVLPFAQGRSKRISKVRTLQEAIEYIHCLQKLLNNDTFASVSVSEPPPVVDIHEKEDSRLPRSCVKLGKPFTDTRFLNKSNNMKVSIMIQPKSTKIKHESTDSKGTANNYFTDNYKATTTDIRLIDDSEVTVDNYYIRDYEVSDKPTSCVPEQTINNSFTSDQEEKSVSSFTCNENILQFGVSIGDDISLGTTKNNDTSLITEDDTRQEDNVILYKMDHPLDEESDIDDFNRVIVSSISNFM